MEIAPDIHRIPCLFMGDRVAYVHLLIGEASSILLDTCCAHNPAQEILPYMERIGFDRERLSYILISHSDLDHQGGNCPMKAATPRAKLLWPFAGPALDREHRSAAARAATCNLTSRTAWRRRRKRSPKSANLTQFLPAGWHAGRRRAPAPRPGALGANHQYARPQLRPYRPL